METVKFKPFASKGISILGVKIMILWRGKEIEIPGELYHKYHIALTEYTDIKEKIYSLYFKE